MPTTTQQQLLDLAAQYEQKALEHTEKAKTLRRAAQLAAEMNGTPTRAPVKAVPPTSGHPHLDKAIALRRKQTGRTGSGPEAQARQGQIREALAQALRQRGEATSIELTAVVQRYGIGRDRVRQILVAMGARSRAHGNQAIWTLRGRPLPPPAQGRAAAGMPKKKKKKATWKAARFRRIGKGISDRGRAIVQILKQGGPMTTQELSAAARAAGVGPLTGIRTWCDYGYISHDADGRYRWRSDPQEVYIAEEDGPVLPPPEELVELVATPFETAEMPETPAGDDSSDHVTTTPTL